jgi:tRNA pseudouridine65 synthase
MNRLVSFIHRDPSFVVVDKPSGVVVHRGMANEGDDLMRAVRDAIGVRVHPVHRLDRGTSGAIVMATTPESARMLCQAFAERRVEKRYLALTRGRPPDGEIDHAIPRSEDGPRVAAVTRVRCVAMAGRYALVEAIPLSGRMHQIRRHLKHVSCPIIGDAKYGKGEHNRHFREIHGLHRLALHASDLGFAHPRTGEWLRFSVAPSGELLACLQALGLMAAITRISAFRAPPTPEHSA